MGFFSKILGGNDSQTIVRCDEAEFLIWKYQGGAVKSGTSIIVKDGEVAVLVGSSQTTIEGPANTTASEDLSEVFFINLAGSNVVRFAVPYFGVNDPRYPDLNVPVAVRGSINFNIEDYKGFIRMHRLVGFDMEAFQKKIKDAVIKYVKSVVSNIPTDHSIPVVQMEKKILEIGEILNQYLKQRLAIDFAINVRAVDLNAIEYDADDESYKQLRALTQGQAAEMSQTQHKINMDQMKAQSQLNIDAMRETQKQDLYNRGANLDMDRQMRAQDIKDRGEKMRIQRDLGEKAYNAQIDEMQKSGRMAMGGMPNMGQPVGGFNPSGINGIGGPKPATQIGQPSGINMGGGINSGIPTPTCPTSPTTDTTGEHLCSHRWSDTRTIRLQYAERNGENRRAYRTDFGVEGRYQLDTCNSSSRGSIHLECSPNTTSTNIGRTSYPTNTSRCTTNAINIQGYE